MAVMEAVEPNIAALVWFGVAWFVSALAFFVVLGMFPLSARPDATRGPLGFGLIVFNAVLLAGILAGTAVYGWQELRWTTVVIVASFGFLFAPSVFEIWPARWRDSRGGLVVLAVAQAAVASGLALAHQSA